MTDKKASRDGFGKAIAAIGRDKNIVVLDADLSESTRSAKFREKYPDRFFNMGIAEQDMIGTAAGMAASGKIPFACSFAVFITGNGYAQIRLHAGISKLNIKIIGSHAGLLTGEDGASHQSLEDISMLRAIPGMAVVQPADFIEAEKATKEIAKYKGAVYLRLGRAKLPIFHKENYKFRLGKGDLLRKGRDITIFATGALVYEALQAAEKLEKKDVSAEVINIHTIKPLDSGLVVKSVKKTGRVITCEDHNVIGGMGSAVQELLCDKFPCKVNKIGINDKFGESGRPMQLYEKYGLTSEAIYEKAVSVINKGGRE
ncbi:transketolase family protein [Candidatus Woesearchaeota archaeon]|nr:transketolase family protein [Candidatus Woesearchaeota archaeon]